MGAMTRRDFIVCAAGCLTTCAFAGDRVLAGEDDAPHRALYWEAQPGDRVRCLLCPHGCVIAEGRRGVCRVRENRGGVLYSLSWGRPCALHIDPIEKKPFFHFLPGTTALSTSTVGCNMRCMFCQNWQISQSSPEDLDAEMAAPDSFAKQAVRTGAASIAYTYGEPVVYAEYVLDIARSASESGIMSVVVTNGYIGKEPLIDMCRAVDAVKVDLKAFEEDYYGKICGGELAPVLDSLKTIKASGTWLEIVYLVVPTLNDDPGSIRRMADWLVSEIGPDVPLHFSRFHPAYRLSDLPPTPVSSLETAREICMEAGIRYVYIGNVAGHEGGNTYCHSCSRKIIDRTGYRIRSMDIESGACRFCGAAIPGVWEKRS